MIFPGLFIYAELTRIMLLDIQSYNTKHPLFSCIYIQGQLFLMEFVELQIVESMPFASLL